MFGKSIYSFKLFPGQQIFAKFSKENCLTFIFLKVFFNIGLFNLEVQFQIFFSFRNLRSNLDMANILNGICKINHGEVLLSFTLVHTEMKKFVQF